MASANITPDQDAVVREIQIAAPAEKVFQALIDPKQVMQWWTSDECQIDSFAFEPRRGGQWRYDTRQTKMDINGVSKFHCEGEVLEFDPPRVLAYTWIANWHDQSSERTVVRWELVPVAAGTKVKVTHSGLRNLPVARKDYGSGWKGVVETLKDFVEKRIAESIGSKTVTTHVAVDQNELVSEIRISADPSRVFQALVDPQQVLKWWGQAGVYQCTEFSSDLRVGGRWRSAGIGPEGSHFEVSGEYLEVDPPRRLTQTWVASWTGDAKTEVRWELRPTPNGTLLRIRHCGLAAHPELAQSYRGWPRMLGWIQTLLETGETVESRMSTSTARD
ncbi:MAG: SRPBCC domain-containing protein [Acidobacteriaceae bacterium]|nr:SRPBCC domain-containing protein [Acidobacteriaceae bacterium]